MYEISLFIVCVLLLVYINECGNIRSELKYQNEVIMRLIREVEEHKRRLDILENKEEK